MDDGIGSCLCFVDDQDVGGIQDLAGISAYGLDSGRIRTERYGRAVPRSPALAKQICSTCISSCGSSSSPPTPVSI